MNKQNKEICLATVDFSGLIPVGGIGTYYDELARLLSRNGWNVIVLFHQPTGGSIDRFSRRYFDETGVRIYDANELCKRGGIDVEDISDSANPHQARSHVFHEALQELAREGHQFDLPRDKHLEHIGMPVPQHVP